MHGTTRPKSPQAGVLPGYMPMYIPPAPVATNPAHTEALQQFWATQVEEVQQCGSDPSEFKNTQLPLARIKKVLRFVKVTSI